VRPSRSVQRDLSFTQVVEAGLKAYNDVGVELDGHGPGRLEAIFEYGSVWLHDEDMDGRVRSAPPAQTE
jgi:hypothetical protein